MRRNHIIDFLD